MNEDTRTIYIDCSATYYLGINTGIQRVIRNVVKRAPAAAADKGVRCVPIISKYGQFWQSDLFLNLQVSADKKKSMLRIGSRMSVWLEARARSQSGSSNEITEYKGLIPKLLIFARKVLRFLGYRSMQIPFLINLAKGRITRIRPRSDDVIVLPDAFWAYDVITPLRRPRYNKAFIVPMIHDLIPITHPQFCAPEFIEKYSGLLPELISHANAFILISESTRKALTAYLETHQLTSAKGVPTAIWYSGADLTNEPLTGIGDLDLRSEVQEVAANHDYYLMVGTIEPRKGYDYVLATFEKLWAEGYDRPLTIVGRVGWMCESLLIKAQQSPHYGKLLHIFTNANDRELDVLYRGAAALIFASHVEGFGLPLVEAMQKQLPLLASDIDVFKEIAGDAPTYFRVGDIDDLQQKLRSHDPASVARHEAKRWHTWDDAANAFIETSVALAERLDGTINVTDGATPTVYRR